jgi:hypothetical protein
MRIISWFSCGAASAVATKLAIEENKKTDNHEFIISYCEIEEEHPDNKRFLSECEDWFNHPITILRNEKYQGSIYKVFDAVKFLRNPSGAPCTRLLKKEVRNKFQQPGDIQIIGYTSDEMNRIDRFIDSNNEVDLWPILADQGLNKQDCMAVLHMAGIELPMMYKLGYKNNNCIGCVKGGQGYWNKIRVDFPEVFERMAQQEEKLGASINYKDIPKSRSRSGKNEKTLIPLRELNPNAGNYKAELDIQCGIFCMMASQSISS